ncbi:RNase H family protein [Trifolium repens]|nr:RNase H family protein [Trifolium repens]
MADLNMRMMEVTEIIERNHLDVMTKINQITETLKLDRIMDADAKLQQGNMPISHATIINSTKQEPSCTIAFAGEPYYGDGGRVAGAGVVLFAEDGSLYCGFREGKHQTSEKFKRQTKEDVEYRALILGMKQAIMKGFKHITVEGNSEFVINQVCFIII